LLHQKEYPPTDTEHCKADEDKDDGIEAVMKGSEEWRGIQESEGLINGHKKGREKEYQDKEKDVGLFLCEKLGNI